MRFIIGLGILLSLSLAGAVAEWNTNPPPPMVIIAHLCVTGDCFPGSMHRTSWDTHAP